MNRPAEAAVAGLLAVAALGLAVATPALTGGFNPEQGYFARPSFFPWLALGLVIVFGTWTAGQAWRGVERDLSDEIEAAHTSVRLALLGAALFGGYVLLAWAIGYAAATFATVLALALCVKLRVRSSLVLAATTTAILYTVFVWGFKVWFAPSWVSTVWAAWN